MKCPRCNGRIRVERDELTSELEGVCMSCGHRQPYQEEPRMESRISTDPFGDARKSLEVALNAPRSELGAAESRIGELRGQVKRLESAFLALTAAPRSKAVKADGTPRKSHAWSPEAREAQAERMRQTNAARKGQEAAATA